MKGKKKTVLPGIYTDSNTGGVYDADSVVPNFTGRKWYFQTTLYIKILHVAT